MKEASEQGTGARAPGAASRVALRAIDACIDGLTRLRSRFDAAGAHGGEREPAGKGGATDEAAAAEVPRRGFFLRGLLVGLASLLVGGGAGAFAAYRLFEQKIGEHAGEVERMQEEIDVAHKEERRSVNLMARFQRENAEMRLQLRAAEREAEEHRVRADELDKALAEARRPVPPAARQGVASAPAARPKTPQKTGNCTVGGADPGGRLAECVEKFNQP